MNGWDHTLYIVTTTGTTAALICFLIHWNIKLFEDSSKSVGFKIKFQKGGKFPTPSFACRRCGRATWFFFLKVKIFKILPKKMFLPFAAACRLWEAKLISVRNPLRPQMWPARLTICSSTQLEKCYFASKNRIWSEE